MLFTHSAGRLQNYPWRIVWPPCSQRSPERCPITMASLSYEDSRGRNWRLVPAFWILGCLLINLDGFQQCERPTLVRFLPLESEPWPNCHFSTQFSTKTVALSNLLRVSQAHSQSPVSLMTGSSVMKTKRDKYFPLFWLHTGGKSCFFFFVFFWILTCK